MKWEKFKRLSSMEKTHHIESLYSFNDFEPDRVALKNIKQGLKYAENEEDYLYFLDELKEFVEYYEGEE